MPQRRGEQGGLTIEQVGVGALVVTLVASLIGTGLVTDAGATVADGIQTFMCRVAGQDCGGGGGPDGQVPGGPAPAQDGGDGAPVAGPDGAPDGGQPAGGQGQPDVIPLDNVQLAAAETTGIQTFAAQGDGAGGGGGGGGGSAGSQESRLPRRGPHTFQPKKGQRLSEPVQCDPGGGGCLPARKGNVSRESDGSFVDKRGNRWQWDPVKGEWDVQHKDGTHTNVSPDGEVTHGPDNFPNKERTESGGDTAKVVVGGVAIGGALWWAAKILSPACGPFAPACAVVL